jgi:M3 family oligoendopeptidase
MVESFRKNVLSDLVPVVSNIKGAIKEELGYDELMFYDNDTYSAEEAPDPIVDTDGIFRAAVEMYDEMSTTTGKFMRSMLEAEAFDVESREGKWGGGYCTTFPDYKQPFILANFNGTAGDIDVMTHEFGHALAAHYVFEEGDVELDVGGMETAECHSMGMEFFSWPYMDRFFTDGNKYRRKHLVDALSFIPYGVIIDEFQEEVYSHPEYTPAERNALYLRLEEKYRPYLDFSEIPYLSEGTRWQYQMHVYEAPFYYIDYCLAQTVALGFLLASQKDYADAFSRYLTFVRAGGTLAFDRLVARAELPSPFEAGALEDLAEKTLSLYRDLKKDA